MGAGRLLVGAGVLLGILVAAATATMLYTTRARQIADVRRELGSLSYVLADQADRMFEAIELVEKAVVEQMTADGIDTAEAMAAQLPTQAMNESLRLRITGLPQIDALSLIDRDGNLLNFSRFWPVPQLNVADREYFRAMKEPDAPDTFVSVPLQNRTNNSWSIYIAHRISGPDGRFLGVALGAVGLQYLQDFYARVAPQRGRAIALVRADGTLLAHYPALDDKIGQNRPDTATAEPGVPASNHQAAFLTGHSPWDGALRFTGVKRSTRYPIVINASATTDSVLARWWRQATLLLVALLLVEAGIAAIVLISVRQVRGDALLSAARRDRERSRRAAVEAKLVLATEREAADRERSARDQRFRMALDNMKQGLSMFDPNNRLLVMNEQFATLFGLPADAATSGMGLRELFNLAVGRGAFTRAEAKVGERHLRSLSARGERETLVARLSGGRFLAYAFRPMDDGTGWVLTCDDITKLRQAEQQVMYVARHDALTDLPNRLLLRERIAEAVTGTEHAKPFAVLCLNLDGFKTVNDTLGHPIGDAVLQEVSARLLRVVHEMDTVARIAGDDFAIVQVDTAQPAGATSLAVRLLEELALPYDVNGHQVVIAASVGITVAPYDGTDIERLLKNADLALHRVKAEGGGGYRFFETEMDARMQQRRHIEVGLRQALRQKEFRLFYQPLVNMRTRKVTGFEALLRWQCPARGMVSPDVFIPLAEELGLITAISEWALVEACMEAVTWPNDIKIAVNLSSAMFTRGPAVVVAVEHALRTSGLAAWRLEVEITETLLLQDTEDTLATLRRLKALGVRVSMDDFGTGYSSLSYLQKFPFDKVKIDQSFVRGLGVRSDCGAIVHAISGLCSSLGITTTAEGVETEDQLDRLAAEHCQEVQGYLFSPPRPGPDIPALIARIDQRGRPVAA